MGKFHLSDQDNRLDVVKKEKGTARILQERMTEHINEYLNPAQDGGKDELVRLLEACTSKKRMLITSKRDLRQMIQHHLGGRIGKNTDKKAVYIQDKNYYREISPEAVTQIVNYFIDELEDLNIVYKAAINTINQSLATLDKEERSALTHLVKEATGNLSKLDKLISDEVAEDIARHILTETSWTEEVFAADDRDRMVLGDYVLYLDEYRQKGASLYDCLVVTDLVGGKPIKVTRKASFELKKINPRGTESLWGKEKDEYVRTRGVCSLTPIEKNQAWEDFLVNAIPDEGMRESLLQALAIGIFGAPTSFRNFLDIHGKPRSGKSSIMKILSYLFEDFIVTPSNNAFNAKGSEKDREYALADAEGARLVYLEEFTHQADSSTVKKYSGGNKFTTSKKYANSRTWLPEGTLVFLSNPGLSFDSQADEAFLSRWLPVYFPNSWEGEIDEDSEEGLFAQCQANLPGIFLSLAEAYERAKCSGAMVEEGVFQIEPSESQREYKRQRVGDMNPHQRYLDSLIDGGLIVPVDAGDDTSVRGKYNPQVKISLLQKGFECWLKAQGETAGKTLKEYMRETRQEMHPGNVFVWKGFKLSDKPLVETLVTSFQGID